MNSSASSTLLLWRNRTNENKRTTVNENHEQRGNSSSQGFDVTIISPHSEPYIRQRDSDPFIALSAELGMDFYPMAFDIYGSVGRGTEAGIHSIGEFLASRNGTNPTDERHRLLLMLSYLVLQRTAIAVNIRQSPSAPT